MFDCDVFVLGGGPAGLSAAIAARMAGFRVLLADAERPPIDKACGEGLMPDSLEAASRLGVELSPDLGFAFRGISFCGAHDSVSSDFPNGAGIGIRRPFLQQRLIERAAEVGVEMIWGRQVSGLAQINARWIIGADGAQSCLRRWAGLQHFWRNARRFSYRRHYRIAPWSEYMEIHWGNRCQFYVTPVSAHEICLVLMTHDPQQRIGAALPLFPVLEQRLAGCEATSPERGALAATRRLPRITNGNIALIGDASGTIDPITGEGMCLAFKQAVALADALEKADLSTYERAHVEIGRRPRFMSDFMLLMDRSNSLQRRTLKSFASKPELFSKMLAMHVGQLTPLSFAKTAAALGWNMVIA